MSDITPKLYVVVDRDLTPGLKIAQACHAMRLFTERHPDIDRQWFDESNNLVVLHDGALAARQAALEAKGFALVAFHEPDLDDRLTALCVEPKAWRDLSNLPLAH